VKARIDKQNRISEISPALRILPPTTENMKTDYRIS
jgi:hypothetical protein